MESVQVLVAAVEQEAAVLPRKMHLRPVQLCAISAVSVPIR